jgi:uncharacterized protein
VHSISILLGFAAFRTGFSSSLARPLDLLKSSSNVFLLALRGLATATSIAVVEEMVFRSWLPEEIAVDLGYYNAILISGLVFSLIHRYVNSVPPPLVQLHFDPIHVDWGGLEWSQARLY